MSRLNRAKGETPEQLVVESYPSDVAALLSLTSPTDRALLLLVDVEGESIGDAAASVGITAVAARARLSRVRRRLRAELEGDGHDR
jgi:DNA-directed RNA polymerase specialized sigma24 family protein